jgi:hypothetical protein
VQRGLLRRIRRIKGMARRLSVHTHPVQDILAMLASARKGDSSPPYRVLFVSHSAQLGGAGRDLRRILSRPIAVYNS